MSIFDPIKDPKRRPRIIIWAAAVLVVFAVVMIIALGVTSSYWFCANACHKTMDDPVRAYNASSHNEVNCYACHMPVNASPVTFMLHKMEALGELYMTITNAYSIPLNANDQVALEMPASQCTQCHSDNRVATPSRGIKIEHSVHSAKGIACTICHNRVAHPDAFRHTNKDPKTGNVGKPHPNWMTMTACFRCHSQKKGGAAPGECPVCHTPGFQLKPASHLEPGFYPVGHGKLALAEINRSKAVRLKLGLQPILSSEATPNPVSAKAESGAKAGATNPPIVEAMPPVQAITSCYTCHDPIAFCVKCHGLPMPHQADWKQIHGAIAKADPTSCAKCHGAGLAGCNSCHHGTQINWNYNPSVPWRIQHPSAVKALGAGECFKCHDPAYCAHCHVTGTPVM